MNAKRLLPVLLAAMGLPAYAQDDSGLWAMLDQLDSLGDTLLLLQDAQSQGAAPGAKQIPSSPDNTLGAGPSR